MKVNSEKTQHKVDIIDTTKEKTARTAYETALQLGRHAVNFAAIERAPRYKEERHENDAEHSFMLSLVAPELAAQLLPHLNGALVTQFAVVHDLVELETGDMATFALSEAELEQKEVDEHNALQRLLNRLPPHTASLVGRYEEQHEPEARFVRLVDKLLPLIANIYGPGRKVMRESFGIGDTAQLQSVESKCSERLRNVFPENEFDTVHMVRDQLAQHFQSLFEIDSAY